MADQERGHPAAAPWFGVSLAAVELPDGQAIEHYVVRRPPIVLTAMLDERDRVLLVWRYRFITGTWAWKLPSGLAHAVQHVFWTDRARQCSEPGWETTRLECP